ncbi:ABC transporter B family member 21 [Camellia lanceoleosa]|uniref:ABC transporter B family member 21 n=1 Tax=Camellia lanceoleosa TaxID=1840588 RepID=A0ACC0G9V8_9ERIC|nr:ABC transporter B family member 21 [Camellia lanceoleosa]
MSGNTILIQDVMGEKVASFTREKQAVVNYNKSLLDAYKLGIQEGLATGLGFGLVMFITFGTYALAIWFGRKMIVDKGYSRGSVINASPCMSAFVTSQVAAYKMFETIKSKLEIDASKTSGKKLDDIRGDIELRDVHFSYPARSDEQIFSGFSLSIPSGTAAALVGQSGSGKSTVISLIE